MPALTAKDVKIVITGDPSQAEAAFKRVSAAARESMAAVGKLGVGAAAGLLAVEGAVVATSARFENYRIQLETIEGSQAKANRAMSWVTEFAKKTPYELDQVTEAYVRARAYGIDPTNGSMQTLGNTASAMGKPLMQAVEAMADAMTGENERLKEFGIKASVQGDQIYYNWVDASGRARRDVADNNAKAIESTLTAIWNEKYAGGMERMSQSWDGMVSNMGDSWTSFEADVGDGGAFDAAKSALSVLMEEVAANDEEIKALAHDIGDGLVTAMQGGVVAGAMLAKGFEGVGLVIDGVRVGVDALALTTITGFDVILSGMQKLADGFEELPGSVGDVYAKMKENVTSLREDLADIKTGIVATGAESLDKLTSDYDTFGDKVDQVGAKIFAALEQGRAASAERLAGADTGGEIAGEATDPVTGEAASVIDQKLADRFAKLEEELMSEEMRLQESHIARQQIVADSIEAGLITEERGLQISENLNRRYAQAKLKVEQQAADARLSLTAGAMNALSTLLANGGRASFEASKALAIGETIISTYSAAQKAYESQMTIPTPDAPVRATIAAGIAVAQGLARVAAISSASYGSKGSAGGASTPGGMASQGGFSQPTAQTVPTRGEDSGQQQVAQVNIKIEGGGVLTPDFAASLSDQLAPHIDKAMGRGRHKQVVI